MKTGILHMRIDPTVLDEARVCAETDGRSLSNFVEQWIKFGINQKKDHSEVVEARGDSRKKEKKKNSR